MQSYSRDVRPVCRPYNKHNIYSHAHIFLNCGQFLVVVRGEISVGI